MQTFDIARDLSGLENDYQILEELHESADSRMYLARHLQLNRDVAITVMAVTGVGAARVLARYEADLDRLKTLRHPNVIPVIESRRLGDDRLAVVRARVRGSSLEQLVSALGPIPHQRVAAILDQVRGALEWARMNGLADRHVSQDAMIFQQGSGRVLLSLDVASGAADLSNHPSDDPRDDARTIGSLGWEMLSGQRLAGAEVKALAALRPDLSRAIVDETTALVRCWRGGPVRDTAPYIALLAATEPVSPASRARPTPVMRVATIESVPVSLLPKPQPPVDAPPSMKRVVRATEARPRPHVELMPKTTAWPIHARIAAGFSIVVTITLMTILYRYRQHMGVATHTVIETTVQVARSGPPK